MEEKMEIVYTPPRMVMVWDCLERAKDAGDSKVIDACRRLINADRIGWKKHASMADWRLVQALDE
jgi:hypothetical protein